MENILITPLSATDFLRLACIVLFGIIIFFSFIYGTLLGWFVRHSPRNRQDEFSNELQKEPVKIIGGLGILMVALVANIGYLYVIALFIGGLLIASERFMINLAAIFNSDRKGVKEISRQWNKATPLQVEKKQEREAEENAVIEEAQQTDKSKVEIPIAIPNDRSSLIQIKDIERLTLKYLRKRVALSKNLHLEEYVQSFDTKSDRFRWIYDAIVVDATNSAIFAAEIRYMKSLRPIALRRVVSSIREKMQSSHLPILIIIVFDESESIPASTINEYLKYFHDMYSNAGIAFYKRKNGALEVMNEEDLERLLIAAPIS